MSADAWRVCPKCKDMVEQEISSAYGKVSQEDYMLLLEKHDKILTKDDLREDYELYTDELGLFFVRYSCHCSTCGFQYKFEYEKQIYEKSDE